MLCLNNNSFSIVATLLVAQLITVTAWAQPNLESPKIFRAFVADHGPEILGQLRTLVAIPNVSSQQDDVRRNANYLKREFTKRPHRQS